AQWLGTNRSRIVTLRAKIQFPRSERGAYSGFSHPFWNEAAAMGHTRKANTRTYIRGEEGCGGILECPRNWCSCYCRGTGVDGVNWSWDSRFTTSLYLSADCTAHRIGFDYGRGP